MVETMRINANGNVGIGTTSPGYRLQVGDTVNWGYISSTGQWTQGSDASAKQDIRVLEGSLDKVGSLSGVSYVAKGDPSGMRQVGFVAQDVEKIVPEVVSTDPSSGLKGIAYPSLVPLLAEAIKELQARGDAEIRALREENAALKDYLTILSERLEVLESDRMNREVLDVP
jgi:hypothetical protein